MGQADTLPWIAIVGLLDDVKQDGLDTSGVPHLYRPLFQQGSRTVHVLLRTRLPAARLEPDLRGEIGGVDAALPVFNVRPMHDILGAWLAPRRFSASTVGAFALLALVLSSIGIYGLLAFLVSQRGRELSIRLALGARPRDIFVLVLGRGAALAGAGVLVGLALAAAATPALRALLFGVRALDPAVFAAAPLLLLAVALLASWLPARRAAVADPAIALRDG